VCVQFSVVFVLVLEKQWNLVTSSLEIPACFCSTFYINYGELIYQFTEGLSATAAVTLIQNGVTQHLHQLQTKTANLPLFRIHNRGSGGGRQFLGAKH